MTVQILSRQTPTCSCFALVRAHTTKRGAAVSQRCEVRPLMVTAKRGIGSACDGRSCGGGMGATRRTARHGGLKGDRLDIFSRQRASPAWVETASISGSVARRAIARDRSQDRSRQKQGRKALRKAGQYSSARLAFGFTFSFLKRLASWGCRQSSALDFLRDTFCWPRIDEPAFREQSTLAVCRDCRGVAARDVFSHSC